MKYCSTRGITNDLTFEDALLSGYLADGGICLPKIFPKVTKSTLQEWSALKYKDIVKKVVSLYVSEDEVPKEKVAEIVDTAFRKFPVEDVIDLAEMKKGLNILELFHGPTLAFKDLAMSCVGQFLEYFLEKRKKHITIIVGTSGDTGSAAIESVRGSKWIDLVVLLPKGRTAKIQELQMTTVIEDNIHVFRVDGTSDDLDVPIMEVFKDLREVQKHNLCSINSINWCRIMIQTAHYFYAYFKAQPTCEGEAEIVVPTGACGNVTSGVIAKKMGLPVKFVCTVNTNDIVARTLHGDFSKSEKTVSTLAPAMDIQYPYNIERLLYIYSGGNCQLVRTVIEEMMKNGASSIPDQVLAQMQKDIGGYSVSDEGIKKAMQQCWQENGYLLCPHTATAAKYHYDNLDSALPRICIATASPAKFEEAVIAAGLTPMPTDQITTLFNKPTKYVDMEKSDNWLQMLKNKLDSIHDKVYN